MTDYKRKIHIINNTRDSEKCNDLRKTINSSYRQKAKVEIKKQLEDEGSFFDDEYDYAYNTDHWEDWKWHPDIAMQTVGGKFLSTLIRLGLIEGGPHKDWYELRAHSKTKNFFYHPCPELLRKLTSNDDGLII